MRRVGYLRICESDLLTEIPFTGTECGGRLADAASPRLVE